MVRSLSCEVPKKYPVPCLLICVCCMHGCALRQWFWLLVAYCTPRSWIGLTPPGGPRGLPVDTSQLHKQS